MANPLTELLLMLVNRTTFNSEQEQNHAMDLLREIDSEDVPPAPGPMNQPATPEAPPPDPGPTAEPVPPEEQPEPPTSPEVTGSPEETNAFSDKPKASGARSGHRR